MTADASCVSVLSLTYCNYHSIVSSSSSSSAAAAAAVVIAIIDVVQWL